ncbi:hypothetical protein ON010_g10038 [Phytophthora cinnamomi]|nr:hypothetical protein ON010_g10038 [Phytophthora cinnamomi]
MSTPSTLLIASPTSPRVPAKPDAALTGAAASPSRGPKPPQTSGGTYDTTSTPTSTTPRTSMRLQKRNADAALRSVELRKKPYQFGSSSHGFTLDDVLSAPPLDSPPLQNDLPSSSAGTTPGTAAGPFSVSQAPAQLIPSSTQPATCGDANFDLASLLSGSGVTDYATFEPSESQRTDPVVAQVGSLSAIVLELRDRLAVPEIRVPTTAQLEHAHST